MCTPTPESAKLHASKDSTPPGTPILCDVSARKAGPHPPRMVMTGCVAQNHLNTLPYLAPMSSHMSNRNRLCFPFACGEHVGGPQGKSKHDIVTYTPCALRLQALQAQSNCMRQRALHAIWNLKQRCASRSSIGRTSRMWPTSHLGGGPGMCRSLMRWGIMKPSTTTCVTTRGHVKAARFRERAL